MIAEYAKDVGIPQVSTATSPASLIFQLGKQKLEWHSFKKADKGDSSRRCPRLKMTPKSEHGSKEILHRTFVNLKRLDGFGECL
ncbi:hypothetical protein F442_13416 [Phytophthora nicotianae P10297]|uniref:Uncharacterized protein n=3 Tax=Phytophthora nicotianae TaxID=4792 RepID=W2YYT1_PHYNI|nr:hypothetical protein L914_13034 [Phytophthora nicotianae]ETO69892.1 hypothetical protein F444_13612 [Phytophthora nicotianae P1976]ETP39119.1 hypothetical protein F442_13416 [Phytophthora nicotianae P10297]